MTKRRGVRIEEKEEQIIRSRARSERIERVTAGLKSRKLLLLEERLRRIRIVSSQPPRDGFFLKGNLRSSSYLRSSWSFPPRPPPRRVHQRANLDPLPPRPGISQIAGSGQEASVPAIVKTISAIAPFLGQRTQIHLFPWGTAR